MPSEEKWVNDIEKALVGRKITEVRYLTPEEADEMGWSCRAIVLTFNDGTELMPSMDDEGNNAGALFTNIKGLQTIPVFG